MCQIFSAPLSLPRKLVAVWVAMVPPRPSADAVLTAPGVNNVMEESGDLSEPPASLPSSLEGQDPPSPARGPAEPLNLSYKTCSGLLQHYDIGDAVKHQLATYNV